MSRSDPNPSADPAAFAKRLEREGRDYLSRGPLGGPRLQLQFLGPFQGEITLWDATFMTRTAAGSACDYIDIGAPGPEGRRLEVAIAASCIDQPTVLKLLMMLRQYKRLAPGRHRFGARRD